MNVQVLDISNKTICNLVCTGGMESTLTNWLQKIYRFDWNSVQTMASSSFQKFHSVDRGSLNLEDAIKSRDNLRKIMDNLVRTALSLSDINESIKSLTKKYNKLKKLNKFSINFNLR